MKHKEAYYWYCQVAGWGLYIALYTFFYISIPISTKEYPNYFQSLFFEAAFGFLLTHFIRFVIRETKLLTVNLQKQILWLTVIIICFSVIYSVAVVLVEQTMNWEPEYFKAAKITFWGKCVRTTLGSLLYITIWCLLYFAYHYVSGAQRERINHIRLEAMVKELELKTIKAHINPHFIFNALNSIRALVDENPERARTAITELSQLLRSSMNADKEELVSLEKELTIVKHYLALEQIRFEDRLKVSFRIDENTLLKQVPPMMLQTLVENAIKHGISKEMRGGHIDIISDIKNNFHELVIRNTGKLNGNLSNEGFGLNSTRNRLSLLFGEAAIFEIKDINANEVEARVMMPMNA